MKKIAIAWDAFNCLFVEFELEIYLKNPIKNILMNERVDGSMKMQWIDSHDGIEVTSTVTMLTTPRFIKAPRIKPHGKAKY